MKRFFCLLTLLATLSSCSHWHHHDDSASSDGKHKCCDGCGDKKDGSEGKCGPGGCKS